MSQFKSASLLVLALVGLPAPALAGSSDKAALDIYASGILASGTSADGTEDSNKSGGLFGAALSYDLDSGADQFSLDLSSAYYIYSDATRADRWSNRIGASYGHEMTRNVTVAVLGDLSSHLATLESREADQAQVRGRLTFDPGDHRIRFTGGWRWRDYRDNPGFKGDGPVLGADYRYRLGEKQYVSLEGQYEKIDASLASRSYRRTTVAAEYRFPLAGAVDVTAGLRYRAWNYPGRAVGLGTQHDHSWAPELALSWEFARDWYAEAEGTVISRDSNDPAYAETVKRAVFTLRKRFRL